DERPPDSRLSRQVDALELPICRLSPEIDPHHLAVRLAEPLNVVLRRILALHLVDPVNEEREGLTRFQLDYPHCGLHCSGSHTRRVRPAQPPSVACQGSRMGALLFLLLALGGLDAPLNSVEPQVNEVAHHLAILDAL